ncbi:hypothetical protein [Streptomyces sp. NPDC054865]
MIETVEGRLKNSGSSGDPGISEEFLGLPGTAGTAGEFRGVQEPTEPEDI